MTIATAIPAKRVSKKGLNLVRVGAGGVCGVEGSVGVWNELPIPATSATKNGDF